MRVPVSVLWSNRTIATGDVSEGRHRGRHAEGLVAAEEGELPIVRTAPTGAVLDATFAVLGTGVPVRAAHPRVVAGGTTPAGQGFVDLKPATMAVNDKLRCSVFISGGTGRPSGRQRL